MNFFASLIFGIVSVCLGGITGSFVCIIAGKLFNKKYLNSHFTIVCILLSIAVAAAAAGFVFITDLPAQLGSVYSCWIFFLCLFITGALCSCFWKIVLPLVLTVYIILSVITGIMLYGKFGSLKDSSQVSISEKSVKNDDDVFYVDSVENKSLVIQVYTLPSILLLPLPRVWYSVIGVADSDYLKTESDITHDAVFSGLVQSDESEGDKKQSSLFWKRQLNAYSGWILQRKQVLLLKIPQEKVYPSIYSLVYKRKGESFTCRLEKLL